MGSSGYCRLGVVTAVAVGLAAFTGAANATTVDSFLLNYSNGCTNSACTTLPLGTIKVSQVDSATLKFQATLQNSYYFMGGSNVFGFSLDNVTSLTYAGLPNTASEVWTGTSTPSVNSTNQTIHIGDGTGYYMFSLSNTGSGGSGAIYQSLTFTVKDSDGSLSLNDIIPGLPPTKNSAPFWMAVDIGNCNGTGSCTGTGYGAASTKITETLTTPLPGSLPLFIAGLGAVGLIGWRRKRKTAALAT